MLTLNTINKVAGDIEMPRLHKNIEQLGAFGSTGNTSPCHDACSTGPFCQ